MDSVSKRLRLLNTQFDGQSFMRTIPILLGLVLSICWIRIRTLKRGKRVPGPPKSWIPWVGNYFQLTDGEEIYLKLTRWAREYGEVYEYSALGERTFVISGEKASKELFEIRGSNYSSRTRLPLLNDFVCLNANIGFLAYSDEWRRQRKAVHRELNINAFEQYRPIQTREAYQLCRGFLERSEDELLMLAQRFGGAIGLGLMYDHRVTDYHDPIVEEFSQVLEGKLRLLIPLASMYDLLPWFRWLPEFVMPSKKLARETRERGRAIDTKMSRIVQERLDRHEETSSFHASLLRRDEQGKGELTALERDSLSGTNVGAAVDTTTAGLITAILALVCYQDVQAKVRAQVDAVVPRDRMPTADDLLDMPYVEAFVKEALRWRSPDRYGLPHAASESDYYEGIFIPKGSTVMHLAWAFEHDENRFPDNDVVKPERFLNADGSFNQSTPVYQFGVGRRICPGANLAIASLKLAVACLVWSFELRKGLDAQGNEIEPDASPENSHAGGNVYRHGPFKFKIVKRDSQVDNVIIDSTKDS